MMNPASSESDPDAPRPAGKGLDRLAGRLETRLRDAVRDAMGECLTATLRAELGRALAGLPAGESGDRDADDPGRDAAVKSVLDDACLKLEQILHAMERATLAVMDLVERRLTVHDDMLALLDREDPEARDRLRTMFDELQADLLDIITSLGFQDLTGQRIKRVMGALGQAGDLVQGQPAPAGRGQAPAVPPPAAAGGGVTQDQVDAMLGQLREPPPAGREPASAPARPDAEAAQAASLPLASQTDAAISQSQVDALLGSLGM